MADSLFPFAGRDVVRREQPVDEQLEHLYGIPVCSGHKPSASLSGDGMYLLRVRNIQPGGICAGLEQDACDLDLFCLYCAARYSGAIHITEYTLGPFSSKLKTGSIKRCTISRWPPMVASCSGLLSRYSRPAAITSGSFGSWLSPFPVTVSGMMQNRVD